MAFILTSYIVVNFFYTKLDNNYNLILVIYQLYYKKLLVNKLTNETYEIIS